MTFDNVTGIEITHQWNDGRNYVRQLRISHGADQVEDITLRTPMSERWLGRAGNIPITVDRGVLTP